MVKFSPMIVAMLLSIPNLANADHWWSALGWSCDPTQQQLTMYPVQYDANGDMPETREGLFVPQSHFGMADGDEKLVLECEFSQGRRISISLSNINTPKPRGACGGAAWSEYVVRDNEKLIARFPQGCTDTFVIVGQNNTKICPLHEGCKFQHGETPLDLNFFGTWAGD